MDDGITRLEDIGAALYESAQPPLVTIYSPTHGLEARTTDRRRFEEMAARARERLAQRFERRERAGADRLLERLAERFDELAGPSADGALAAFVSNEGALVCNLDRHVEPIVVVGDAFLVRPLLKELGFGSRYLLLGLSADRFALIRGSFGSLERVKLPADVPGTYSEEFPDVYDGRPGALDYPSLENHLPPYHGHKSRNDVRKEEAEKFFRSVNEAVSERLARETEAPVILVALPEHQTSFRRISTIPHLLDEGIEKDVGGLSARELLDEAKGVIERERARRADRLLAGFGDAAAHGRGVCDLSGIGLSLAERRVRALFVAEDADVPGAFDAETGEVSLIERGPHERFEGPELVDQFARAALAQDAEVFELDPEKIPGGSGMAALYRY